MFLKVDSFNPPKTKSHQLLDLGVFHNLNLSIFLLECHFRGSAAGGSFVSGDLLFFFFRERKKTNIGNMSDFYLSTRMYNGYLVTG